MPSVPCFDLWILWVRISNTEYTIYYTNSFRILERSGKTRFVEELIKNNKLGFKPRRILYIYPEGILSNRFLD